MPSLRLTNEAQAERTKDAGLCCDRYLPNIFKHAQRLERLSQTGSTQPSQLIQKKTVPVEGSAAERNANCDSRKARTQTRLRKKEKKEKKTQNRQGPVLESAGVSRSPRWVLEQSRAAESDPAPLQPASPDTEPPMCMGRCSGG